MINTVEISKKAQKDLRKVPKYITQKLTYWVLDIEEYGLEEVRKQKGYHDEPLQGKRLGQRSIRLNRAYRAIYITKENGTLEFVEIQEVNKHDY